MRSFAACLASAAALLLMAVMLSEGQSQDPAVKPPQMAKGVVYHDANGNQKRDADEKPLPGVRVSNGSQIVTTNEQGQYTLPVDDDTILFVIKPRGWRTPLSEEKLPRFYYNPQAAWVSRREVQVQGGCTDRAAAGVGRLPALPAGRTGPVQGPALRRSQPRDQKEVDWITHDVVEGSSVRPMHSFGVTLGDIAFDNLETFEPLNRSIALIGIPWYNVLGNHDINYDARTRRHANETTSGSMGRRTTPSTMGRSTFWCWMTSSGC